MDAFLSFVVEHRAEILEQTLEHIRITLISLFIACLIGISLGILVSRYRQASRPMLGFVNIVQTIPSVALLGFLLPFFGIGITPAIIALFLYALLPIVRNTFAGIAGVEPSVIEAARGLGMSRRQILTQVELPLAVPVIFAGIRTAMVINIGVATLTALIAAGGLGEYIFRGIAVNNTNMILAGAIPASLLAIFFDSLLGIVQRFIGRLLKPILWASGLLVLGCLSFSLYNLLSAGQQNSFVAGFNAEFMEREDGYPGLQEAYGFSMDTREMEIGLMYEALNSGKVDVISGFSTDGRIRAYNLRVLEDDVNYFPPYYAAPIVRINTLEKFPRLREVFRQLSGKISEQEMMDMNYQVDELQRSPRELALSFLEKEGFQTVPKKEGEADLVIGSKAFTENFILAEIFAALIEGETSLVIELRQGFGGTKLLMDAIKNGDVDMYPEYTGTGLLVLLQPPSPVVDSLINSRRKVYEYVREKSEERFGLTWLQPLGFNNTTALMMREEDAASHQIESITDLKEYLQSRKE